MTNIGGSGNIVVNRREPPLGASPTSLPSPLGRLPPNVSRRLCASSLAIEFSAGSRIFGPGQTPEHFLLLLDGVMRVQQTSDKGREIILYRVLAGESCALTTAFLMGCEDYQAEGIAETRIRALAISRSSFDELITTSREFREFVFSTLNSRISNLFRIIEELAFSRIDVRLAQKLIELGSVSGHVTATHQELANELGSAREVISRQINEFQRRGWIKASRGTVDISNRAALFRLTQQA